MSWPSNARERERRAELKQILIGCDNTVALTEARVKEKGKTVQRRSISAGD
jgi:hypothetical protein